MSEPELPPTDLPPMPEALVEALAEGLARLLLADLTDQQAAQPKED